MSTSPVFDWKGLLCVGSRLTLELPRMVILNSTQSKQPCGGDSWVEGTLKALESCSDSSWTLLSSTGMNTWELVCWAGGMHHYPQIIGVPWNSTSDPKEVFVSILQDYDLLPER